MLNGIGYKKYTKHIIPKSLQSTKMDAYHYTWMKEVYFFYLILIDLLLIYSIKLPLSFDFDLNIKLPLVCWLSWWLGLFVPNLVCNMRRMGKKLNKDGFVIVPINCHCIVGVVFHFRKVGEKIMRKKIGNFYWKNLEGKILNRIIA